ncbi:LSM domain [Carpediemonas membranifera]|uniref:LSM domain n=1 Tax=Carpediemonas membranifera TaxID=201153 RepID=A0A8J6BFH1_9EUKA|nr:LSM domain [Carpediemonas membranifera]|eukprot:KAG9396372.1 LSM domain [Carpediemonas membranifera]
MQQSDCAINFASYVDKAVLIKCSGGRKISGVVKSFDDLSNVVLQDADELIDTTSADGEVSTRHRKLGVVVIRGQTITDVCPAHLKPVAGWPTG